MHELSIALSILDIAAEERRRLEASGITAIHLKLGLLSGVVKEALLGAYEMAAEGSAFQNCRLVVQDVPITARCLQCGVNRAVVSIQEICCRVCGTPTPEIVSGREMEITGMEIC